MSEANKAVDTIVRTKLSEYNTSEPEVAATTPAPSKPTHKTRNTYSRNKPATRRVTSYDEYAKRVPAIQTPSVLSKEKVDAILLQCRELPTPDKPIKNYAGYSREEWDKLLEVLARYMADVCEGAGLQYKGSMSVNWFRKGLSVLLQESFMHADPYDKKRRFISVDGRIDSDERKP